MDWDEVFFPGLGEKQWYWIEGRRMGQIWNKKHWIKGIGGN
jgi:hypothetical protein